MRGSNERVKRVFITVVIKEVSTKDFLNKKDDERFLKQGVSAGQHRARLCLPAYEVQQVVGVDPESKRKDRRKNERISVEELILHIQMSRQDVGGNDGNQSYQGD